MTKTMTLTLQVTYEFSGEFLNDYLEYLDDYPDSYSQREYFAIDRLIGHDELRKVDPKATFTIREENN